MAAVDVNSIRYVYRGEVGEAIPREATHITVAEDVTVILASACRDHPNIVEVICHEDVEKIERMSFAHCFSMRRVIMPGVKIVREAAFYGCPSLEDVECDKLEIIKDGAFHGRKSLKSISLPSVRIVEEHAFLHCRELVDVKFGNKLERIDREAFLNCTSLERITLPLKDSLMTARNIFQGCSNLKRVDLAEGEIHETIAALQLEDWRNDMNEEIDSINQILPTTHNGYYDEEEKWIAGEKARAIWTWMRSVIGKIIHYQAEHQRLLDNDIATTLQLALPLPRDIVLNNVLPLLKLPPHTFEVGDQPMEVDSDDEEEDVSIGEAEV